VIVQASWPRGRLSKSAGTGDHEVVLSHGSRKSEELEQCKLEVAAGQSYREEIPDIVRQLVDSCGEGCF